MSAIYRNRTVSLSSDAFGRPNTNPPDIVEINNVLLYEFTLNTDKMFFKFPVPSDYHEGDFTFFVVWTNDGGADDNEKDVKWQIDYQTATMGDPINGSHANSPKVINDTYTSDTGWIEHHTGIMTIAAADFAGKTCIYIKLTAITPDGVVLTCEPHLVGVCFTYNLIINEI